MQRPFLLLPLFLLLPALAAAQDVETPAAEVPAVEMAVPEGDVEGMPVGEGMAVSEVDAAQRADSLAAVRDSLFALRYRQLQAAYQAELQALREEIYQGERAEDETVIPELYRLLGPATYYQSATDPLFSLEGPSDAGRMSFPLDSVRDFSLYPQAAIDEQLALFYLQHPELVRHHEQQFADLSSPAVALPEPDAEDVTEDIGDVMEALIDDELDLHEEIDDIGLEVEKPNFWTTSASFSLQFTQNYFSDNWYQGGNNTQTMLAGLTAEANYNDEQKVTWENKLTMKLGFVTSPSDSCHSLLTNNDKFNLYSKLGIQAHKSWYYTLSFEANTQFLAGYNANDPAKYSAFISPLDVYVSLGMDYKPTFANGNTLSVALLPLSYKFRYIGDDDENIHSNYSLVGKDTQHDFGSKIELNAKVTLATNLTWTLRSYFYTAYDYVEAELENTFAYAFNKYLSTQVYTLWRFDDSRSRDYWDDTLGYFQFKEYFTFGLAYSF